MFQRFANATSRLGQARSPAGRPAKLLNDYKSYFIDLIESQIRQRSADCVAARLCLCRDGNDVPRRGTRLGRGTRNMELGTSHHPNYIRDMASSELHPGQGFIRVTSGSGYHLSYIQLRVSSKLYLTQGIIQVTFGTRHHPSYI